MIRRTFFKALFGVAAACYAPAVLKPLVEDEKRFPSWDKGMHVFDHDKASATHEFMLAFANERRRKMSELEEVLRSEMSESQPMGIKYWVCG